MGLLDSKPATRRTVAGGVAIGGVVVGLGLAVVFGGMRGEDPNPARQNISTEESTTTQSIELPPAMEPEPSTSTVSVVTTLPPLDDRVGQLEEEVDDLDQRVDSMESTTTSEATTTTINFGDRTPPSTVDPEG